MIPDPRPIGAFELNALLNGDHPPVLLDVRLPEDCDCQTLPGARGNCVFEVAFIDRMPDLLPDPETPVCVFGAAADSAESRMAAEKLVRLGYTRVYDFRDGVEGWKAAGFPVVSGIPESADPIPADGTRPIDLAQSHLRWTGRNLLNHHRGLIGLKAGWLHLDHGRLAAGAFTIDMHKLRSLDLEGSPLHDVLIHHLLSDDFFDAGRYPEAVFEIISASPVAGATPGSPNLAIEGSLTLKGVTHPLGFTACAGFTPEGKPAAQATLAFDRTLWNVLYGSGRWFRRLGGHLVNDRVELEIRIVGS